MAIKSVSFRERGGWWVVGQFIWFGVILVALSGTHDAVLLWKATGWVLIACGALLCVGGLWVIRSQLTAMPAPLEDGELRQRGPYLIVRHPIYGGLILGFAGLAIRGGNLPALALSLPLIPFFYAKTRAEERMLMARFPEYAEYRQRVRYRVLPWIL